MAQVWCLCGKQEHASKAAGLSQALRTSAARVEELTGEVEELTGQLAASQAAAHAAAAQAAAHAGGGRRAQQLQHELEQVRPLVRLPFLFAATSHSFRSCAERLVAGERCAELCCWRLLWRGWAQATARLSALAGDVAQWQGRAQEAERKLDEASAREQHLQSLAEVGGRG